MEEAHTEPVPYREYVPRQDSKGGFGLKQPRDAAQ